MKNSKKIKHLNKLLILNFNAEKAFIKTADALKSDAVAKFLRLIANDRSQFIKGLDAAIREEGGTPELPDVSAPLTIGYGLNELLKNIKTSENDFEMFTEIGKIQMIDIEKYKNVINLGDFSDDIERVLNSHKENIVMTLYAIDVYKDSYSRNRMAV